jgi:hypothetical protein
MQERGAQRHKNNILFDGKARFCPQLVPIRCLPLHKKFLRGRDKGFRRSDLKDDHPSSVNQRFPQALNRAANFILGDNML